MAAEEPNFSEELEHLHMASRWGVRLRGEDLMNYYVDTSIANSKLFRSEVEGQLNVPYGHRPEEKMDIFGYGIVPEQAPILVFFHGGYWIAGNKDMHSFVAKPFVQSGIAVVIAGYPLAPAVTLDDIVVSAKACATAVVKMAAEKRSVGVFLSGHSAGAHLASMILLDSRWTCEHKKHIRGAVLFSGVFDVLPLLKTSVGRDAKLTKEQALRNTPLMHVSSSPKDVPVQIVLAEHDSPVFHQQAKAYNEKLTQLGVATELLLYLGEDHFTFFERLFEGNDAVTGSIVRFVLQNVPGATL